MGRKSLLILLLALVAGLFAAPLVVRTTVAIAGHIERGALDDNAHLEGLRQSLREKWVASWMMMTEQLSANMMHQMWIIGMFFDAKHQLESHRLFQELTARAHKDYHPSDQMCRFGTNLRSIGASDEKSRVNALALSTILMNRETLLENSAAGQGPSSDIAARTRQFKQVYCDIHDHNDRMRNFCRLTQENDGEEFTRGAPDERTNKDISFPQTIDNHYTLDIDFTDTELTPDEADVLALGKNLFAHTVLTPIDLDLLEREFNKDELLDMRSLTAMRGIARNSYGHIVGQRAAGTEMVAPFLKKLVEEMGVPITEIDQFLGETPSYFAQMEVMTHKMYQNPSFYAHLYTKPANVERTGAALQAISLMQDRDRFEAALRREMLLAIMLELKIRDAQNDLLNELANLPFTPGN